jgi:predicted RNase H-like HicB family nuclease
MTMRYAVLIETGDKSFGAYVPDLPGCVAVGATREEVEQLILEAIEFHLEGMLLDGDPIPRPNTHCCYMDVDLPKVKPGGKAQEGRT